MPEDRLTPEERAVIEAAGKQERTGSLIGNAANKLDYLNACLDTCESVSAYRKSQQKWRAGLGYYRIEGPDDIRFDVLFIDNRDRVLALLNAGEKALAEEGKDARRTP